MTRTMLALTAAALLSAAPAAAQDVRVAYGDLNLSSLPGAVAFDARVADAVRDACLQGRLVNTLCVAKVQREAVRQLPQLRQEEYARARRGDDRIVVRAPADPT